MYGGALWLRSEVLNADERRAPLSPADAEALIQAGFKVHVERSANRIFTDAEYEKAGCQMVEPSSWKEAPSSAVILGLGGVEGTQALKHRHIYFGHAFKNQFGWENKLGRFVRGGGKLLDIEYIVDDRGKRLASFGNTAGYIGMAAGLLAWCRQELQVMHIDIPPDMIRKFEKMPLLEHLQALLNTAITFAKKTPAIVVMGANGLVGRGAVALAEALKLPVRQWTRADTQLAGAGPYEELVTQYDILLNAIKLEVLSGNKTPSGLPNGNALGHLSPLVTPSPPPLAFLSSPLFLTEDSIRVDNRRLSVVVDVSCDLKNPRNPLPIYHSTTTFDKPTLRILEQPTPLDVIAIPTLPSLLPMESSRDFSAQLLKYLLAVNEKDNQIWARAEKVFTSKIKKLKPVPLPRTNVAELEVTLQQERLWKLHLLEPNAYNISRAVTVISAKPIDLAKLRQNVESVVRSQEPLRTSFKLVGAQKPRLVQVISSDASYIAQKLQISSKLVATAAELRQSLSEESRRGFDLTDGPLARVLVASPIDVPNQYVLFVTLHQIIADAASASLFLQQLLTGVVRTQLLAESNQATHFPRKRAKSLILWPGRLTSTIPGISHPSSANQGCPQAPQAGSEDTTLQYADFAHWERTRWVADKKFAEDEISPFEDSPSWQETQIDYWKKQLDGSLHVLQLTTDASRPASQTFDCERVGFAFSIPVSDAIRAFAKSRIGGDHSIYVVLFAVFKVLLYRWCGEDDVIIGSTVAGRPLSSLRHLIGPFSNLMAIRTFIHDKMSFQEVLEKVKEEIDGGLLHQEVPFERTFEELRGLDTEAKKTASHNVLFHVRFNSESLLLQDVPLHSIKADESASVLGDGAAVSPLLLTDVLAPTDLDVTIQQDLDKASPLSFSVVYNRLLFQKDRIEEFHRQFELLASQVVANYSANVISYNLVTEWAKARIPDPFAPLNATWRGSIQSIFSTNAKREPERVAVSYQNEVITYGDLERITNKLANYFRRKGLQVGDVVAIYGHRSPAVVVAIVAILKAGCAYSMIDPAYPATRIQQCLDIAKPKSWLAIAAAGEPVPELQVYLNAIPGLLQITLQPPMVADKTSEFANDSTEYPQGTEVGPDSLAVVTFTSGSTGLPKGVMGRHGPLTHYYPWMSERFGIGREDRFSMCSGIAHDPLQRDIFTPLFFSAAVYIPTQEDITTPGVLAEWMKAQGITVTCMTPALGQLLTTIDTPTFTIDTLRNAFFVGDMLIKRDVLRLRRLCPQIRVINMYGSTETQRSVGYFVVQPSDEGLLQSLKEVIPAGVGMQGCDTLVLNSRMQLAGIGEVSEIYMRSHHLARGYVGLEEQTKEKFIPNPFSKVDGDRLYKTGDLGRYAPSGMLECFGRADDQVKIRGFRIELGEINATLSLHPSVKENVTIVREDTIGEKRIVSYVVPTDLNGQGQRITGPISTAVLSKELRAFLSTKLPSYMVPSYVVILKTMPLTPNGKINRPGLPPPVTASPTETQAKSVAAAQSVRPLTKTEDSLVRIWARVLAIEITGPEDNFFELGGHSVLATRLTFEVAKELKLGKQLPVQLLFLAPTIGQMAAAIDALVAGAVASGADQSNALNLMKEVQLPSDIDPKNPALLPATKAAKNILLTGATGFLGAFLLRELLEQIHGIEGAKIFCLVRAGDEEDGYRRLHRNLVAHMIWQDKYKPQIVAVAGDLSKLKFGLSDDKWKSLAAELDLIIHNGAFVHWLQPYEKLKTTNVNGTVEVIRLCCDTKVKPLHYVSTTSVFDTTHHEKLKVVYEDDPLPSAEGISGGYPQSKWVAEKIAHLARSKGLPVAVYRPGYVTGDAENGVWNTDDFLCRLIKACIQLRAAPDLSDGANLDMSPVDYVCRVIAAASVRDPLASTAPGFNLVNPNAFNFEALFKAIKSFGYDLEVVPYATWRQRLIDAVEASTDTDSNALGSMITFFSDDWPSSLVGKPKFDNKESIAATKNFQLVPCPPVKQLLPIYVSYLIQCSFVPPPLEVASNNLNIDWSLIREGVQLLTRTGRG